MKINVSEIDTKGDKFHFGVTVLDGKSELNYNVTSDKKYLQSLSKSEISTSDFIKKTFEFLLERESKESILKSFDISIIKKYFPEYEKTIRARY